MSEQRSFGPLSVGGGWLVDELLFRLLVNLEIQKAQRLRYSVSLVFFDVETLSAGDGEDYHSSVAESVTRHIRVNDSVVSLSQCWLTLILVESVMTLVP